MRLIRYHTIGFPSDSFDHSSLNAFFRITLLGIGFLATAVAEARDFFLGLFSFSVWWTAKVWLISPVASGKNWIISEGNKTWSGKKIKVFRIGQHPKEGISDGLQELGLVDGFYGFLPGLGATSYSCIWTSGCTVPTVTVWCTFGNCREDWLLGLVKRLATVEGENFWRKRSGFRLIYLWQFIRRNCINRR